MQTSSPTPPAWLTQDRRHTWHPYSAMGRNYPVFPVASAQGVHLTLADGRRLVDGMASWWCAIHGYNHPVLNQAIADQMADMAHVMFGGLTHRPAAELTTRLAAMAPGDLPAVFLADSGSVAVEVAMKMAVQYWAARGQKGRQRFVTVRGGYHGDTLGAMSVCDPVTGMHTLFADMLPQQLFADRPAPEFGQPATDADMASLANLLAQHGDTVAALILEPVVQGAGGMRFYSADYLTRARALCDQHDVLLIADEIATGFGRTGRLFACEHAGITPDILCVGKALTGGYMTLAATLASAEISDAIADGDPGVFMHGPTFMGNPLACAVANASLDLLAASPWQARVAAIEAGLRQGLADCAALAHVADVRVLGAIGVVELTDPVDMRVVPGWFVDAGVWVRPFGRLIYLMPPIVMEEPDLDHLTGAVVAVVKRLAVGEGLLTQD